MRTKRRVLGTAAVVLLLVAAPLRATWSAFSAVTADAGNTFAAGTVMLTDDDDGSAMITGNRRLRQQRWLQRGVRGWHGAQRAAGGRREPGQRPRLRRRQ
jgi:hypothetical protein